MGREALERIRAAAARGWTCHLRVYHAAAIAMELDAWMGLGLSGPAASRIRAAVKRTSGIRLSIDECRAVAEASR